MKRNPQAGVTQLELLVSLSVMALIAVLLANALNFGRQGLERTSDVAKEVELLIAHHQLKEWIEAIPTDFGDQTADSFFRGTGRELNFQAPSAEHPALSQFTLSLGTPPNATLQLYQNTAEMGKQTLVLAVDVTELSISYFGRTSDETETRWHNYWKDTAAFPNLVKFEWQTSAGHHPPITAIPARVERQRFMSRSSLLPPG